MSKPTALMLEALCIVPDEWAKCAWPDWAAAVTVTALHRNDLIEFRRVREGYQYRRTSHGRDALLQLPPHNPTPNTGEME